MRSLLPPPPNPEHLRRLGALSLVALVMLYPSESRAQPRSTPPTPAAQSAQPQAQPQRQPMVLLAAYPPECEGLAALLRAELAALAIGVLEESPNNPNTQPMTAVVRLSDKPRSAAIWTRKSMRLRSYAADPRLPPGSDELLAQRVAEVLRADLLLAPTQPAAASTAPAPVPAPPTYIPVPVPVPVPVPARPIRVEPLASPGSPRAAIGMAPTLTLSPGPFGAMAHMTLDARWYVWRGLRLRALGVVPLAEATIEDARGSIRLSSGLLGASLAYDLVSGPFTVAAGAGLAWQWIDSVGVAAEPYRGVASSTNTSFTFVELDAAYHIDGWLALTAGVRLGVAAPEPVLVIADEEIGNFGRPATQLSLGVAVPFGGPSLNDARTQIVEP